MNVDIVRFVQGQEYGEPASSIELIESSDGSTSYRVWFGPLPKSHEESISERLEVDDDDGPVDQT